MNRFLRFAGWAVLLVAAGAVGALVARGLDRPGAADAGTADAGAEAPAAAGDAGGDDRPVAAPAPALTLEDLRRTLAVLPEAQREAVVGDADSFERFVRAEAGLQSLLAAARANGVHERPEVALLMQRQADRVLAEAYLRELARINLGAGYPSEEQVRQFFDDNAERFAVPQRLHVWQIFWPLAADADPAAVELADAQAEAVREEIRAGKLDFAAAAELHSGHAGSRVAGGYMGLISVDELLPEVREAVADLAEGAISEPVRTASGVHLVRRGALVPARKLTYEEAAAQARSLLINESVARLRESVARKASESYPVPLDAERIARWREALAGAGDGRAG